MCRRFGLADRSVASQALAQPVVLTPGQHGETLQIELTGIWRHAEGTVQTKRSPESDDLFLEYLWLRNGRYLQLWSGAD